MFTYAVYLFLIATFELVVADDPKFVGKFQLEESSQDANYKKIFEEAGFTPDQVKKLVELVPTMTTEIIYEGGKITCIISSKGKQVSNTFEIGKRTRAKLLIGGYADATVYIQNEYRLTVTTVLPKGELVAVWDCDDEACGAVYSVNKVNLVTKWKRVIENY